MPATNTFKSRIQLKMDTEANWNTHPIVPLAGELIIYSADGTHSYSRLKVGDGVTTVVNLPFIDAGTIQGNSLPEEAVISFPNRTSFPYPGVQNVLYIDQSTIVILQRVDIHNYQILLIQYKKQMYQILHIGELAFSQIIVWRVEYLK